MRAINGIKKNNNNIAYLCGPKEAGIKRWKAKLIEIASAAAAAN